MSRPAPGGAHDLPSYLDPREIQRETQREANLAASRAVAERREAAAAASAVGDDEVESRWLELSLYGLGGVLVVAVGFLVISAGWVRLGRSATEGAAERFSAVLHSESAVVYDLGGDRRFEELFTAYSDAQGAARIAAAVGFADELERVVQRQRGDLDPAVQERVDRILASRDAYADAYGSWQGRANGFPGSVAVSLGIVRGP
jgi:hypothetical protein